MQRSSGRSRFRSRRLPVRAALVFGLLTAAVPFAGPAYAQAGDGSTAGPACMAELARIERGTGGYTRDLIAGRLARATAHCEAGRTAAAQVEISRIQASLRRIQSQRRSGGR